MKQDSSGPDIDWFSVRFSLNDFRCHEVWSADSATVHALAAAFGLARQLNGNAETAQFDGGGILFTEIKIKFSSIILPTTNQKLSNCRDDKIFKDN